MAQCMIQVEKHNGIEVQCMIQVEKHNGIKVQAATVPDTQPHQRGPARYPFPACRCDLHSQPELSLFER